MSRCNIPIVISFSSQALSLAFKFFVAASSDSVVATSLSFMTALSSKSARSRAASSASSSSILARSESIASWSSTFSAWTWSIVNSSSSIFFLFFCFFFWFFSFLPTFSVVCSTWLSAPTAVCFSVDCSTWSASFLIFFHLALGNFSSATKTNNNKKFELDQQSDEYDLVYSIPTLT